MIISPHVQTLSPWLPIFLSFSLKPWKFSPEMLCPASCRNVTTKITVVASAARILLYHPIQKCRYNFFCGEYFGVVLSVQVQPYLIIIGYEVPQAISWWRLWRLLTKETRKNRNHSEPARKYIDRSRGFTPWIDIPTLAAALLLHIFYSFQWCSKVSKYSGPFNQISVAIDTLLTTGCRVESVWLQTFLPPTNVNDQCFPRTLPTPNLAGWSPDQQS